MHRFVVACALVIPALIALFFRLQPEIEPSLHVPLFHFYIVTFTSFAATVVSFLLIVALGSVARPRHVLAAVAFAVMGSLFMTHGLTTPGALITAYHPLGAAASWSSWLTLFSGGIVFAVAGFDRSRRFSQAFLARFIMAAASALVIYIAIVITMPSLLGALEASASPWHRQTLFLTTLVVWLLAVVQLFRTWRQTRSRVDGSLVLVAVWLVQASVSMHLFPKWYLSWWLYHFLLLSGFLFTAYILFTEYEQVRQFRLIRYYVAASLILTALLALAASYLFTQYAQRILTVETAQWSADVLESYVANVSTGIPEGLSAGELQQVYSRQLDTLPVDAAAIYDVNGERIYPENSLTLARYAPNRDAYWDRVLAGETVVFVETPEVDFEEESYEYAEYDSHDSTSYEHDEDEYEYSAIASSNEGGYDAGYGYGSELGTHMLTSYIALGPAGSPVAILVTHKELPHLTETILNARSVGLFIATATMGVLFAVLLVVVRRADRIISSHTEELAVAYRNLRQAEEMRDDLSHMIVHDMRTPLTTISVSLDVLKRLPEQGAKADILDRIVARTNQAVQRLDRMIDEILTVGKIETGELKPKFERVLLADLLGNWVEPFYVQAVVEEKTLNVECEPEVVMSLDPTLMGRVLDNLISNAFKYTSEGGHIEVSAVSSNGDVFLSVCDDGEGIPDDYKEYIFHKFSQVPTRLGRPARKGTGLGLTFCRLVVEVHGGKIWVEDAVTGGSEFKMRLPIEPTGTQA